jgi:hypothetical protein
VRVVLDQQMNRFFCLLVVGNANQHLGSTLFVHQRIISAVKTIKLISSSVYIIRDRWCCIVLNVHAPTEDKGDDKRTASTRN